MATVTNTLKLNDKMVSTLGGVMKAINSTIRVMENMDVASSTAFHTAKKDAALAANAVDGLKNSLSGVPPAAQAASSEAARGFSAISGGANNAIAKMFKLTALVYGLKKAFDGAVAVAAVSDQMVQSDARLNLINDGLATTLEYQNKIFASANRARASYLETVDAVTKLGINAADAFSSTDEIIAFSELVNKAFKVSGADAQAQAGAMRQLAQALASGVLRGDEFNSIAEQAPMMYQAIADYMGKSKGEVRALASEGALTAAIVKNAMLAAAEDIEGAFSSIPMTFSDTWTKAKNSALQAFQPVLMQLNEMLNDQAVQTAIINISNGFKVMGAVASWALNGIAQGATWVNEHLEALQSMLTIIAAVTLAVGATMATAWILAHWPILMIIAVIMMLISVLEYLGIESESTTNMVAGFFGGLFAFIYNIVAELYNLFATFAEFFANVWIDPIGSVMRLFAGLADYALGIIQSIASAIDAIFGSNLSTAINGWRTGLSDAVTARYGEPKIKVPRMEQMDVSAGVKQGQELAKKAGIMLESLPNLSDAGLNLGAFGDVGAYGSMGDIGHVGSVGRIDDDVTISEEDIKLLKDIASRDYQLSLTQLTPRMSVKFGDVRETADAGAILEFIEDSVIEALNSSLVVKS